MRVSDKAKQAERAYSRESLRLRLYAEPEVWTDRMLAALENGVKRGRWYSLYDKIYTEKNLRVSFGKVHRNGGSAGVDGVSVTRYEKELEHNTCVLSEALKGGTYRPKPVKRVYIDKAGGGGKRPLGIPTVRDRVVQTALRHVIEPVFEAEFSDCSYGFRPGRGCKDALREVNNLLKQGFVYVVDADIQGFFDSIPHDRLITLVEQKVSDGRVLELIRSFLKQQVLDELEQWTPEGGTPQGAVISPLLANIYLDPLDRLMETKGYRMVRYADDFVILCPSLNTAQQALATVADWMKQAQLSLHPEKTRTVDLKQPESYFDFLGYRFKRTKNSGRLIKVVAPKSLKKFRSNIKRLTKRCNGFGIERIIKRITPVVRGWVEYFKHCTRWEFPPLDSWIRMRLRSVLRKRRKRKGRSRCLNDHKRWTNAWFEELGFLSLEKLREHLRQSLRSNC